MLLIKRKFKYMQQFAEGHADLGIVQHFAAQFSQ